MIGDRLKALRLNQGLSLRAVARQAGLSATMISQVERNVTQPSLTTLRKLTLVFGETMSAVFAEPANTALPPFSLALPLTEDGEAVWIGREGERPFLSEPRSDFRYERLARGNGQLEVLRAVLEPGQASSKTPWTHRSIECVYVISGRLTAQIAGKNYILQARDSVTFDGRQPHLYANQHTEPVEIILSVTPPLP